MDEKLREEIQAAVAAIFSEKEEADIRKRTEDALQRSAETIQELTASLETKNDELEKAEEKTTETEERAQGLAAELEAAKQEVVSVKTKLAETEKALEEMKRDIAAEKRIAELKEAKVADADVASQTTKIREMSDEDFTAYKTERVALRAAILAELEAARKAAEEVKEPEVKADEKAEDKKVDEKKPDEAAAAPEKEVSEEKEEDITPPAKIDPGHAVSAALNMEIIPSEGLKSKYAELGKAMAESLTKRK